MSRYNKGTLLGTGGRIALIGPAVKAIDLSVSCKHDLDSVKKEK